MDINIDDPANYRKMSEPFPDAPTANAALNAFFTDLRELRAKHKLADVLAVVSVTVNYNGVEGKAMCHCHCGDELRAEPMAAWVFGVLSAEKREMIAKMMAGGEKTGRKSK